MFYIPMIYVNPITGPHAGRTRFCYVCEYGSKPVILVFIKPEALEEPGLLEGIQKMSDNNPNARAFVVCLSGPDQEIEDKLLLLAREKNLTVPLTVLPDKGSESSIYYSLPIRPEANYTFLLYRGRELTMPPVEDASFLSDSAAESSELESTNTGFASMGKRLDNSPIFRELNETMRGMSENY